MTEETILLAALKIASEAERAAYLDTACAGQPGLRERVDALLRTHAHADPEKPTVDRAPAAHADASPITQPTSGDADDSADSSLADEEVLAFLDPSSEPGSLGRLDHYEVLELIGRGGMGVVFKGHDTRLRRIVAIKVLAAQLAASGTARQRFFREARAAAAVRDDHVVSIHAVSDDSGPIPYLVMEFIAGITLEKRIKSRGSLAVKEILRIGMQAAAGLASAHRQGLIHRDVKPANILLENGVERVKIADFGLARAADEPSLSQSGLIAGTPLYMSPEQARGETLDARSDLFSLGSVLYTLCTGRPAFSAANTVAVLKRVCEEAPQPIRDVNPDIPEWLAAVVNRLMSKEADERLQTADELKTVLGQHLAELQQSRLTPLAPARAEAMPPTATRPAPAGPAPWRRRRVVVAAVLLLGIVAGLATIALLLPRSSAPPTGSPIQPHVAPLTPDDPRVLTVSKRPQDRARFRTIGAALDEVEEGMTIRVLDNAVYDEFLMVTQRHRGVTLEAVGTATLRGLPHKDTIVIMRNALDFVLRGFRFVCSDRQDHKGNAQIHIAGLCPGVVLDRLSMTGNNKTSCIEMYSNAAGTKDAPIVIQNCRMREGVDAIHIQGCFWDDPDRPSPCDHVVIRDNAITRCKEGVVVIGAFHQVLVAGNRIAETEWGAVNVGHPLRGTADIVIVNNTLFRNFQHALRILDDHKKGRAFLECKNIRWQNNLVLEHGFAIDCALYDDQRGPVRTNMPGDVKSLLESPAWHFSHNWRELVPPERDSPFVAQWIPSRPDDHLQVPIKVLSRKPGDPDFLRPAKDSPLASGGAGARTRPNDPPLPAYVGAVPPEGVETWDWNKTWNAIVGKSVNDPKVITVSKNPADRARFNTIGAALDEVEEGMTIRVLDNAVYDELLRITAGHRGVTLEAVGDATLRGLPDHFANVYIRNASNFVLRGFRFVCSDRQVREAYDQIHVEGQCAGVLLDRLSMTGNRKTDCIALYANASGTMDAPIVIQNCLMREAWHAINLEGAVTEDPDRPWPCAQVVISNNKITRGRMGITLQGAVDHVLVAGNCIQETGAAALELWDLLQGTAAIFIVNNTVFRSFGEGLNISDDHGKGKAFLKCENIRWQNNLVLEHNKAIELVFKDHKRGSGDTSKPGDLNSLLESREWHFSHNWRELVPPDPDSPLRAVWIPAGRDDHLQVPIEVLSRKPGDPDFLRPAKDSPLASGGAGGQKSGSSASDPPLPPYVGAVPPEGAEPWDWNKTWKALVH
jgi:hypothetical protein